MSQFHAKDYGSVNYNFHPDAPHIKGIIPDPSDEMLQSYYRAMRELFKDAGIDELPTDTEIRLHPERMNEFMDRLEKFDRIEAHHQVLEIIAMLCQNTPSVDDMMQLPYRKRVKFIRFVQKEIADPEA